MNNNPTPDDKPITVEHHVRMLMGAIPSIPIDELEAIINYHEAHDDYAIATETLRVIIQMNVKERTKFINKHKNK